MLMHQERPTATETTGGLYNVSWLTLRFHSWLEHPWQDCFPMLCLALVLTRLPTPFTLIPFDTRHTLFQISIICSITLLGLTLTSVSVLINLLRAPMSMVDRVLTPQGKAKLGFVVLDFLWGSGALLCAAVVAFLHDGGPTSDYAIKWVEVMYVLAVALTALKFLRITNLLKLLLSVPG